MLVVTRGQGGVEAGPVHPQEDGPCTTHAQGNYCIRDGSHPQTLQRSITNNYDIWKEANIEQMTPSLRQKRQIWYGHGLKKEWEYTTRKMLCRCRERENVSNKRCPDKIREYLKYYKVTDNMEHIEVCYI